MKQKNFIPGLVALLFMIACSKESPSSVSVTPRNPGRVPNTDGSSTSAPKGIGANASIKGIVQPMTAKPVLTLFNPKFYAGVSLNDDGSFQIDSLQEGQYNLLVSTMNGYKDTLITNIPAKQNMTYDLQTIKLAQ